MPGGQSGDDHQLFVQARVCAHLASQGQRLTREGQSLLEITNLIRQQGQAHQVHDRSDAVADFSTDAQTLLVIARRLREVTLPMRNRSQSVERSGGGLPVANGLRELQRLAQEMASCDQIAYVPHRTRQKTQGAGERALVVRLPSDRDSFLE